MATTISTQDIVDAKRDIDDIGEAVNEVKIVSPRYGEDFKSLPMIAADAQTKISEWESAISLITQEGGVPALAVSDASGKTQQSINSERASVFRFMLITDFVQEQLQGATFDWQPVFQRAGASKKTVFLPYKSTSYKVSTAFRVEDGTFFEGDGRYTILESTGVNKRVAYSDGGESAGFRNMHIKGNMTGLGSTSAGADGGDGLAFFNMQHPIVENCYFSDIGNTLTTFASSIYLYKCENLKVRDNVFLSGQSSAGADIYFGYYCSETDVSGNISFSEHDCFINGAAVSASLYDTAYHTIANNKGFRSLNTISRHGILLPYDGKLAVGNITGNIMVGFSWCGIYESSAAASSAENGGLNIANNFCWFCGGSSDILSAGIYVSGRSGQTVVGNNIYKTGYKLDGTKRTHPASGIKTVGSTSKTIINSNVVSNSSKAGVEIINQVTGQVFYDLILNSNILIDNETDAVLLVLAGTGTTIDGFSPKNNIIKQYNNDANGFNFTLSTNAITPKNVDLGGNTLVGKFGSVKAAFVCNFAGFEDWFVSANLFKNYQDGVKLTNSNIMDKEVGTEIIFKGNKFKNVTTAWSVNYGASVFGFVYDTVYNNVTTRANDAGRVLDAINHGTCTEFSRSAIPAAGTWKLGDRVNLTTPATHLGAVCTAAGSPGTWVNFGVLDISRASTQADSTATDIAGLKTDLNALLEKLKAAKLMS